MEEEEMDIDEDTTHLIKVEVACEACRATGLYKGFTEPKGVAVICLRCGGSGGRVLHLVPFKGRQVRSDVATVMYSGGSFIGASIGPDPDRPQMSYEEFLNTVPAVAKDKT
jgi:hypothetical protein